MDKFELEQRLRTHSKLEDLFLADSSISEQQLMKAFEDELNPFSFTNLEVFENINTEKLKWLFEKRSRTLDDDILLPPDKSIIFFMHPRFRETLAHKHSYIEMVYVFSGSYNQVINNNRITMKQGDLCILDTNVVHSIESAGENDIIINCLMRKNYFDTNFFTRLSGNDILSSFFIHSIFQSKDYNEYILFESDEESNIHNIIEKVLNEHFYKKPCYEEVINCHMIILFSELLRSYRKNMNSENYAALNNTKISDIVLYIQRNCKDCTLNSTARHFNFHPLHLNKILKKFSNCSFVDLKTEARLKKACVMLENTTFKINAIANEIGYSNMSFFIKYLDLNMV